METSKQERPYCGRLQSVTFLVKLQSLETLYVPNIILLRVIRVFTTLLQSSKSFKRCIFTHLIIFNI